MKKTISIGIALLSSLSFIFIFLKLYPSFGLAYFKQADVMISHTAYVDNPKSQFRNIYLGGKKLSDSQVLLEVDYQNKKEGKVPIIHQIKINHSYELVGKELIVEYSPSAGAGNLTFSVLPNQYQRMDPDLANIDNHNVLVYTFPSWGMIIFSYLLLVGIGLFVGYVTYVYLSYPQRQYFRLRFSLLSRMILAIAICFTTAALLLSYFESEKIHHTNIQFLWGGLSLYGTWMLMSYCLMVMVYLFPYIESKIKEKLPKIIKLSLGIVTGILCVYISEISYNAFYEGLSFPVILRNTGIILGIMIFVYGVSLSIRVACILPIIISFIFGFVNQQLLHHRSEIFLPSNLKMLGVAKQVAGNYELEVTERTLIALGLSLVLIFVILYLPRLQSDNIYSFKKNVVLRLSIGLGCLIVLFVSEQNYSRRLNPNFAFQPEKVYRSQGSLYSFASIYEHSKIVEPPLYKKGAVEEYLSGFESKKFEEKKPHIILIQSEALADYYGMGSLQLSRDPLAYTHSLKDQMHYGKLFVNVYGGGTVNTEYEVLTGNSLRFLPPGSYPYQQFITKEEESMARLLYKMGYHTLGIHPLQSTNYGRNRVWESFGFEDRRFIDHESIVSDNNSSNWVRAFMKDEYMYDYVIQEFENRQDNRPIFTFLVTMQNHGSYFGEYISENNIIIEGSDDLPMMEYLNMIETSDKAFQHLIDYFSQLNEPVVLAIYGDHQPNIGRDFVRKANLLDGDEPIRDAYMWSPYYIWTNFEGEKGVEEDLSAQYLGEAVLETAFGTESLPSYWQAIGNMRRLLPIVTSWGIFYEGEWYTQEKDIGEHQDQFKLLRDMVYYSVGDKSPKQSLLFNISDETKENNE